MDDELEPEVLSYREFRNRETLRAWERRRQAVESQAGRRRERPGRDGEPARWCPAPHGGAAPQAD
jgi:hypothetical protein